MALISTGSTLTFCDSSHLMAALISARSPASSRQTMPISSVTLAWRMLVTRSNLWPNCQMSGLVMSLGGYINHRRVCCGVLAVVGADFFLAAIVVVNYE